MAGVARMMESQSFVLVVVASASALTLYSGFGLGALLLPAYSLFFPVDVAVAATAVVHGALMLAFALFELLPRLRELEFDPKLLPLGGVLGEDRSLYEGIRG